MSIEIMYIRSDYVKILHICTNYIGNKLFKKLFSNLAKENGFYQDVYIPLKDKNLKGRNSFSKKNVKLYYDPILNKADRVMYKKKIKKQLKRVEQLSDLSSYQLIHAHTLYSDGGTAFLLKRKYNIKYVVSVRNTDMNYFYKYYIHYRPFMYKILQEAEAIVFISEAYKKKVMNLLPEKILKKVIAKFKVIPNGIDNDWFENNSSFKARPTDNIKLLFAGTLNNNKNLITVLKVVKKLAEYGNYTLNVAGDGPERNNLGKYVLDNHLSEVVKFHGQLTKKQLQFLVEKSDIFVLPSIHETFGITYIEAMSKGLPVVYTKNEGIDGFFEEGEVGYGVNPLNKEEIAKKIKLIKENYSFISSNCIQVSKKFSWDNITRTFLLLYNRCK